MFVCLHFCVSVPNLFIVVYAQTVRVLVLNHKVNVFRDIIKFLSLKGYQKLKCRQNVMCNILVILTITLIYIIVFGRFGINWIFINQNSLHPPGPAKCIYQISVALEVAINHLRINQESICHRESFKILGYPLFSFFLF